MTTLYRARQRKEHHPRPHAVGMRKVVGEPSGPGGGSPSFRDMTTGQRWRFRRNLVIYIASRNGASQRLLADVFDLPHSRIAAIVKEFRERFAESEGPGPD